MATITNEFPEYPREYRKKPVVVKALRMYETFEVRTLEGVMEGNTGDYLIQGVKGEFYPCKPDIFEATYEPVIPDESYIPITQIKGGCILDFSSGKQRKINSNRGKKKKREEPKHE